MNNDSVSVNVTDGFEISEVLIVSKSYSNEEWIMDSACTYHMTPRKDFLFDFKEISGGEVLMGNDHTCKVTGIGSIKF